MASPALLLVFTRQERLEEECYGLLFLLATSRPHSVQQHLSLHEEIPDGRFGGEGQLIGLKTCLAFF